MKCVRVVNVRGINDRERRAGIVYVGRAFAGWTGHPLGNPFRAGAGKPQRPLLDRYRDYLANRTLLEADLRALWEQTGRGAKPLGCWCVTAESGDGQPVICHAQILAAMLHERFIVDGPPPEPRRQRFLRTREAVGAVNVYTHDLGGEG